MTVRGSGVVILLFLLSTLIASPANAAIVTKTYASVTLYAHPVNTQTNWPDVWDLTQGDLTLSYTIDMSHVSQPPRPASCVGKNEFCDGWYYLAHTQFTEVGIRGEGAGNFNPGPWNTYQGNCGGWMVSDSNVWLGNPYDYDYTGDGVPDPVQDLDDKHALQASGGRDERDYDSTNPNTIIAPFGTYDNYGMWFDRDGVDPWQDAYATTPAPGGSAVPWGVVDGGTYNTGGIYHIVITYHAVNDGLGTMFATVNGVIQGMLIGGWHALPPKATDRFPAGLSFKGDMKHMQVFAGLWSPSDMDYGYVELREISVTGFLGVSDPLVVDFTNILVGSFPPFTVQFTSTTHGGMSPYSYSWTFGDGGTSTEANPKHTYATEGVYTVELTVTPFRCVPGSVTKKFDPGNLRVPGFVGGFVVSVNRLLFVAPYVALLGLVAAVAIVIAKPWKKRQN